VPVRMLFILFLLFPSWVSALTLSDDIEGSLLGYELQEWSEQEDISPEDIHTARLPWTQVRSTVPNPGVSSPPHWYRLPLKVTEASNDWRADIDYARIERLDMHVYRGNTLVASESTGNPILSEQKGKARLSFDFALPFDEPGDYMVYFRVENNVLLNFPLRLYRSDNLRAVNEQKQIMQGLYIGFLVALLLYNLAVYLVIRERYLLYFCGFVLTYLLFFSAHTGLGYCYLWPDSPGFEEQATFITACFAMLMIILFTISFLRQDGAPGKGLVMLHKGAIVVTLSGVVISLFGDVHMTANTMRVVTLLTPLFLMLIASFSRPLGSPSRLVYTVGVYTLALAIVVHSLARQSLIPTNQLLAYASHIGAVTMIAIHSFAIILRLYEQRLEQQRTRRDVIAARRRSAQSEEKLKKSEADLAEKDAEASAKSAFLAMMSHEIRTPLNGVLGMVELLQHTRLDNQQKRYVETISGSGENLLSLLNDVLDLSKIESGKMTIEKREVALAPLINDSLMLYSRKAQEKKLTVTADLGEPLYTSIRTDEIRFKQILNNLLNNAIKFTDKGQVQVSVEWSADTLYLRIKDTGIGISEEERSRLFNSFTQASASTSKEFGGTGLGLTISQRLTELLGGYIELTSTPGIGSTFTVVLPDASPTAAQALPGLTGRNCFIELADPAEREFVREMTRRLGLTEVTSRYHTPLDCMIVDTLPAEKEFPENLLCVVDNYLSRMSQERQCERPLRSHTLLHQIVNIIQLNSDTPDDKTGYRRGNIWVAEDNIVNQKVISGMLRHLDMDCEIFSNGAQVLAAYGKRPEEADMILMDCEMPVMDGYDAAREIRRLQSGHAESAKLKERTPIIALTAHLGGEYEQQARAAGMDDLITKPIRKQTLRNLFSIWLPEVRD